MRISPTSLLRLQAPTRSREGAMQRTNVILYCNARKIGCSGEVPSGAEHESAGSEYSADQGVAITTRAAVIEVGA